MYNPGQELSSLDFGAIIGGALNAVVKAQSQSAQTTVDFIKSVGFQKKMETDDNGNTTENDVPINVTFSYDKEVSPSQVLARQTYSVIVDKNGNGYSDVDMAHYQLRAGENELPIKTLEISNNTVSSVELGEIPEEMEFTDGMALQLEYVYDGESAQKPETAAELILKVTTDYENVPAVMQKMNIQVPILTMVPIPFIRIDSAEIDFNVKINSVSTTSIEEKTDVKSSTSVKSGWFVKANLSASFSNQKSSNSSEEVKKDYSLNIKVRASQDDMPAGVSRILDMLEDTIAAQPVGSPKVTAA